MSEVIASGSSTTTLLALVRKQALVGLGAPLLIVLVLSMMVLPLPPLALDFLFTFNIALSLIVLFATVYTQRPLDFVLFPSLLLVATLLRLALNIASTRVVLLQGHTGTSAAGKVIEAFGEFVIGGSYAVGLVVFAILVIINFVVVTKGAGRISEVTARFTLDAMPGKQLAIDADMNAGLINQDEARTRRASVAREASFYGAMDGASKFVRGDAIAGILILLINVIGGFVIGVFQHNLSAGDAAHNYILLTIGDGLVAQIPSLMLSTAAALLVTRVSDSEDMGQQVMDQLLASPRALVVSGLVIGCLGLVPGMPNFVFLTLAGALIGSGYLIANRPAANLVEPEDVELEDEVPAEERELSWNDVRGIDIIGIEVGYRLIPMVDKNQGGELLARIRGVRKKLSQELGMLIQPVHIRDNFDLPPNGYRITLLDTPVGEGEVQPGSELAINPGQVFGELQGIATRDPAFGLDALWIEPASRDEAQTKGYTVVDCSTVVATHLNNLLRQHAAELLGHDEVQELLNRLAESAPKLVENLVPDIITLGVFLKVMQNLLQEGVPLRDMRSIAEALAEYGVEEKNADLLTGHVRAALARAICKNINGVEPEIRVVTLDPELERILLGYLKGEGSGGLEPHLVENMMQQVREQGQLQEGRGDSAVLLVAQDIRLWLARLLRPGNQGLQVLAYSEIPANKQIKVVGTVGQAAISAA
ncbi:MAG: flagellar biosynthesis protein FlhA [Halieaceae bacterium]